jgi:hypothetical protein
VSFWDKQDQIHQATHVHGGPAFIPWHRELVNRYEALLRQIDPTVALHYWDWQTDPRKSPDGAGGTGTRPWAPPDNQQQIKNCKHPTIVEPPRYED